KRLGFRDRPDDRMERLGIRKRTHGTNAVVQADELVAGAGLHSSFLRQRQQTKRKIGNPSSGLPANQNQPTKQNQSCVIALSSAAMSGVMLASVSSPMLEMRNVLP